MASGELYREIYSIFGLGADYIEEVERVVNERSDIASYLSITIGCLGIILNLNALVVLFKIKPRELGPYTFLLRSLAFADLFVCIQGVLQATLEKFMTSPNSCSLYMAFFLQCDFSYTASFLSLLLIAINQYIAVKQPLRYNQLVTRTRVTAAIATIWILAVLVHCIDIFQARASPEWTQFSDFCHLSEAFQDDGRQLTWKVFTAMIALGLIVLCVLYIKIYFAARENLGRTDALSLGQYKEKRHSVNTSLLLLGTFLVVYVPYCVVYSILEFKIDELSALYEQINSYDDGSDLMMTDEASSLCMDSFIEDLDIYGCFLDYLENNESIIGLRNTIKEAVGKMHVASIAVFYMEPILLLNSVADPLIYMIRLNSIRRVYKEMMCHSRRGPTNC